MDADLSHDPVVLPSILKGLEDHDMLLGSRYVPGGGTRNWGLLRRLLSRFGGFYARSILGLDQRDCTTGYRGYRTELVLRSGMLETKTQGYGFLVEILYRCVRAGARVLEVPIIFADRQHGKSKLSKAIMFEAMLLPWRLRYGKLGR
jgi:dolichol-phosphate mannosyltransferase